MPRTMPSQMNVAEMSVGELLNNIAEQREIQKDGKFQEGVFRQALDAKRDMTVPTVESDKYKATYALNQQERLDTEKIRSDVSRDDLIAKGWLKVIEMTQLRIDKK